MIRLEITEYEFWQELATRGQLMNGFWYSAIVVPTMVAAIFAYGLMLFSLRRENRMITTFIWIFIASIPIILILPSFLIQINPFGILRLVNFTPPDTTQQFNRASVLQISDYLNRLATMGMIGAALTLGTLFASSIVGGYAPEPIRALTQRITQAVTRAFTGSRTRAQRAGHAPHGKLRVINGNHAKQEFSITDGAIIGKTEATMPITDAIISRRHAQLSVRNGQSYIADAGSKNGTFIRREDQFIPVSTHPEALQSGDVVFLGDPEVEQAVQLAYELAQPEGAAQ